MVVVSSREFRANQRKYFDLARVNDVVITSRSHGSYRLVPISEEDTLIDKDTLDAKIRKGIEILKEHDIISKYFFAPGHTFDENTLTALREESEIRIISDTIATKPYRHKDFFIIPQFSGQCRDMKLPGVYTFCFHPNTMDNASFEQTEKFLKEHREMFISFEDMDLSRVKSQSIFDRLLRWGYFTIRRIKK